MINKDLLQKISEIPAVSGYESKMYSVLKKEFSSLVDDCYQDSMGNFIAVSEGTGEDIRIMVAAHIDEIGLMVKKIDEDGFIKISAVGGIDPRTLPAQKVCIHGKREITGIIGAMPPHLLDKEEREKAHKLKDLYVDTGYEKEELENLVEVGDVITIQRQLQELKNDYVSGKALDDRAGVLMMYECARELKNISQEADIYFVATSQEEVGVKGGITSAFNINPQIGIAIDVTHGLFPGLDKSKAVEMDEGPAISFGPHVHPDLYELFKETAEKRSIPHQIQPTPSPFGTDAAGIQVAKSGVATALISIPQRYMHTSVETISLKNIKQGAILLSQCLKAVDGEFVGGLKCF